MAWTWVEVALGLLSSLLANILIQFIRLQVHSAAAIYMKSQGVPIADWPGNTAAPWDLPAFQTAPHQPTQIRFDPQAHGTVALAAIHTFLAPLPVHASLQVPEVGKIYSMNEGNYAMWDSETKAYTDSLKDPAKWGGKPYSARYIGSLVRLTPDSTRLRCGQHAGLIGLVDAKDAAQLISRA